jgi:hypothetical protein
VLSAKVTASGTLCGVAEHPNSCRNLNQHKGKGHHSVLGASD